MPLSYLILVSLSYIIFGVIADLILVSLSYVIFGVIVGLDPTISFNGIPVSEHGNDTGACTEMTQFIVMQENFEMLNGTLRN